MEASHSRDVLRVLSGPLAGASFEVGDRVLLGRVSECDVHLVDGEVSREHAMLVREGGVVVLLDLSSSNGTFVGGTRIEKHQLRSGDLFAIASSRFVFEDAKHRRLSTQPMLGHHMDGEEESQEPTDGAQERMTQELDAADSDDEGVSSPLRDTAETVAALSPETEFEARATLELKAAPERVPQTVQLEAAEPTVQSGIEQDETSKLGTLDAQGHTTAELRSPGPACASAEAVPVFFPPPPLPRDARAVLSKPEVTLQYTEVFASFSAPATARPRTDYDGDLVADISAYRSFRLRLQRDEIPTGEEVSAMIDLEARLRGPKPDDDPLRDVVALRFFKRFDFVASVTARFKLVRQTVHLEGTIADLSVDGLRCSLNTAELTPVRDQFAVLLIEGELEGACVQYAFTSRVVWVKGSKVGFVFAGAPSWKERSREIEEASTYLVGRSRPT